MSRARRLFFTQIASLILMLSQGAFAEDPGMPMPPPLPNPPTAPKYTNPYFTLTYEWTGNGFNISGTPANPTGSDGSTNTGSLTVFESWALQGGSNGLQWAWQFDSGQYSQGSTQNAKPGYVTYQSSESALYAVPTNATIMSSESLNTQTVVTNGSQSSEQKNLTILFSNNAPFNLQGSDTTTTTSTSATSYTTAIVSTLWNGPPGQKTVITKGAGTTYTDATKQIPAASVSNYNSQATTMNSNGTVASQQSDISNSKTIYATTVNAQGTKGYGVLTSTWSDTSISTGNDANGNQISSSGSKRSRTVVNETYQPAAGVVQIAPGAITVSGAEQSTPQVGPPYSASLTRTTTWAAPPASYPLSFTAACSINGTVTSLSLSWSAAGRLLSSSDDGGNVSAAQATVIYGTLYEDECDIMEIPPGPGEYPFYPNIQQNPFA